MASVNDLQERAEELRSEIKELDAEHAGELMEGADAERWNALNTELDDVEKTIRQIEGRRARLEELDRSPEHVEAEPKFTRGKRVASHVPDDPTKIEEYRNLATSIDDLNQAYRDGALKILDTKFQSAYVNRGWTNEDAQGDVEQLIGRDDEVALRTIITSSQKYRKEFETYLKTQGRVVGQEMERTASLTTTAGGFAVPVELDTTLLLTNAGVVNPIRQIARVRQTNVNTVEFINTTGITAGFGAEATEASDNAPTLAQPTVNIEKAFAFVPMSIEISEDWAGIQQDLALCFADAKNQLESSKFLTGLGHTSNQPQGLIAAGGATAVVSSATTAVFAVADLYTLENALSPRYRARASVVGNRAAYQKARQFATALGPSAWTDNLRMGNPGELIGYPAYEWSSYSSVVTTSGSTILTLGDFSYFAIVDRVGMNIEYIPHLFGSGSRYPTGQRGLYMWWRTSSQVLSPTLTANSAFVSLKLL
jgi:HK97 family phage major capsid protein